MQEPRFVNFTTTIGTKVTCNLQNITLFEVDGEYRASESWTSYVTISKETYVMLFMEIYGTAPVNKKKK